ncbi:hypothetical protein [Mesorhizobium sp.]|uniref:hypothetical protein n=1 Tax=Mesorhizobium sp. TaxID=1871066 RepID=UPI000FE8E624|nr:hypothetical protein [Mesorhizobium sp.]RWO20686.1 MAG: hypothetical protein EOS09_26580 [Mesorhizobium sp.]
MSALYDKRGIPIERGDIVKVFHFIGARRKRHYMYKQCLGFMMIGKDASVPYVKFGHMTFNEDEYYLERPDGRALAAYEIVQSIKCDHDERQRKPEAA